MMRTPEQDNTEERKQEIRLWVQKCGIPYECYSNLSTYWKAVLRKQICTPTHPTSHTERIELYKKLFLPEGVIAGRKSIDPLDYMPDEELRKIFSPLTPGERLPYLYKF